VPDKSQFHRRIRRDPPLQRLSADPNIQDKLQDVRLIYCHVLSTGAYIEWVNATLSSVLVLKKNPGSQDL